MSMYMFKALLPPIPPIAYLHLQLSTSTSNCLPPIACPDCRTRGKNCRTCNIRPNLAQRLGSKEVDARRHGYSPLVSARACVSLRGCEITIWMGTTFPSRAFPPCLVLARLLQICGKEHLDECF
jgi:hypothetical protein